MLGAKNEDSLAQFLPAINIPAAFLVAYGLNRKNACNLAKVFSTFLSEIPSINETYTFID